MVKWVERKAEEVIKLFGEEREILVCNGGLSVSGLQHVGRLRGEITYVNAVVKELSHKGYNVKHTIVLYTVDAWKGKKTQLEQFKDKSEAETYTGRPLYLVPDPFGCHDNWVEHYWEDFGNYLQDFVPEIEVVTTLDLYTKNPRMQDFVLKTLTEKRCQAIKTINKYRKRNPYPSGWIPFQVICSKCLKVNTTVVEEMDSSKGFLKYKCNYCGNSGWSDFTRGKLMWRLEWVGVWYALNVAFEPYGKDHATPGGSRESCNDLARNVYGFTPPVGLAYEWVGYVKERKDYGDMGSSDFIGFTPKDWLEVAEGEVLKYLYLYSLPLKRITLSLEKVPFYVEEYDRAERIYYGVEEPENPEERERISRSYYLAQLKDPPPTPPFRVPYLHAVALVQTVPKEKFMEESLKKLRQTGILSRDLTSRELKLLKKRFQNAENWLRKYAPERYRLTLLKEIDDKIIRRIDPEVIHLLSELYEKLSGLETWNEENIKEAMISIKRTRREEKMFFRALYLLFFGKEYGPRIAPYLSYLEPEFVLNRLREVLKKHA
ncbi:MAG: lysine--tRNA ligase [Thermoprotei archaeon]|nr:MAG: lysine--tRNA ligase [Thermoprotei archaeon]